MDLAVVYEIADLLRALRTIARGNILDDDPVEIATEALRRFKEELPHGIVSREMMEEIGEALIGAAEAILDDERERAKARTTNDEN